MVAHNEYHKASNALVYGGLITYIAGVLLLMSFASPYWIQSYQDTFSEFKHMGLWEYCFDEFRYPYYPFDKIFKGCHYVFSQEYYVIRDWLLPAWLMAVQAFVTLGLILSFISQVIVALELVRWPLKLVLKYEYLFSSIAFVCNTTSAILVFLAVAVFGGQSWRRDWLMYPNYNYLSWSYGFACLSFMFHGIAALFIYLSTLAAFQAFLTFGEGMSVEKESSRRGQRSEELKNLKNRHFAWNQNGIVEKFSDEILCIPLRNKAPGLGRY